MASHNTRVLLMRKCNICTYNSLTDVHQQGQRTARVLLGVQLSRTLAPVIASVCFATLGVKSCILRCRISHVNVSKALATDAG